MNRTEELKKEIERIEKKEKAESMKRELSRMKENVGKGWCTHSISTYMTRGRGAYEFYAFFVDDARIDEEEPEYVIRKVCIIKHPDGFKFETEINDYSQDLPFWLGTFRYEINEKDFTKIYEEAVAAVEVGIDHIRKDQPVGYKVSGGDHRIQTRGAALLSDLGYQFIDMEKQNPLAFGLLCREAHPFLYGSQLLKSPESIKLAYKIADNVENSAQSWGGTIWERDQPRVDALRDFLNKHKTN